MRRPRYSTEQRAEILSRLLAMQKSGELCGVWTPDSMGVQVRTMKTGEPDYISWGQAAELTDYDGEPSPPIPINRPQPSEPRPRPVFKALLRPMHRGLLPSINSAPGSHRHPNSIITKLAENLRNGNSR